MKTNQSQLKASKVKKVKIVIEKSIDSYSAYAENVPGIYCQGDSVDEA